jgi:putative peptide modification system cyclase
MNEAVQRTIADGPQLRTLLLTDLCDSTALVERIGDVAAAELFREHDGLVLQLQQQWRGRLIDRSDGLLLLFERPIDGLGFALDYERGLQVLGRSRNLELRARAGLHVGEVLTWRNSDAAVRLGAKPLEVEGLAKPMAARLMSMARPGQILLSAVAEPLAHRAARELGERGQHLIWKPLGRWRFKGVPESQYIFEVGEPGIAPLRAPPNTPKAWRDIPLWRRPAALAAEAALLAAVGVGVWFVTRPQPAIAFNQRDWVVVADLRNLTGQSVLDDSLEQAFRISLEQSRYVNVLSDLKSRDTLARMQRKPDTVLDRAIASEIALRDGARAVILPTVAEVGGRVRVSVEVIDPHTQATVYAESADGRGVASTLDSIDAVTGALRGSLGEAVGSIEKDSVPLPQVTTRNLDALRAYSLGISAYSQRKLEDALEYFKRATELDPQFALAYMGLVRVHMSAGETAMAMPFFDKALQNRDRLPPRDVLYLDAWVAEFAPGAATAATEKWRLLAGMYPDHYGAAFNYSWRLLLTGRYEEAAKFAAAATAPQNPVRGFALNQLGRTQMAVEQYAPALKSLDQANVAQGLRGSRQQAAALAAARRFEDARSVLRVLPSDDLIASLERIAIPLDQGHWAEAAREAATAKLQAGKRNPTLASVFGSIELLVRAMSNPGSVSSTDYADAMDAAIHGVDGSASVDAADRLYMALALAYSAQRNGNRDVARRFMPRLTKLSADIGDPRLLQMIEIVGATAAHLEGKPQEAVERLRRLVDGSELFQAHVALRDALSATGRHEDALREDRWIARRRGLAYVEPVGGQVLQALNVADTTLARLHAAELLLKLGRPDEARLEAEAFSRAWSKTELPAYLRRRLEGIFPASKA